MLYGMQIQRLVLVLTEYYSTWVQPSHVGEVFIQFGRLGRL